MIDNLPEIAAGSLLGGFGKFLWDRYLSDRAMSTQQLLEKKNLTRYACHRLRKEADDALNRLRTIWKPLKPGTKLNSWPPQNEAIFVRSCDAVSGSTACPVGDRTSPVPLFISLKSNESGADLVNELNQAFESILSDNDISRKLLQRGVDSKSMSRLWIRALGIEINSRAEMVDLLTELSETARRWIFNASIIIEIYLSYDIFYDEFMINEKSISFIINTQELRPEWNTKNQHPPSYCSRALNYVFERSKATHYLKNGAMFGNLSLPQQYSIPMNILEPRYFEYFNKYNLDPVQWSSIAISGQPGSGKTELANILINKLISDYQMIVLVLSTSQQLSTLESISKQTNEYGLEKIVDDQLIQNRADENSSLSDYYSELNEVDRARKDALRKIIKDRNLPILILVDDLHSRRDARASLFRLCAKMSDLNFILIGRKKFTEYESFPDHEKNIHIDCELWDEEQSRRMILSWLPESKRGSELSLFEEWWPSHLKNCSLYLLREIVNSTEEFKRKPSALIRTAIEHHISSILDVVGMHQKSAPILLEEIRNLLRNKVNSEEILEKLDGKSSTQIDATLLLGLLSWYSRYELQSNILDPEKVITWSRGLISSQDEARRFLEKGKEAKIFSLFKMEADWQNKLVAEGCAALYIDHEIDRLQSNSTIANMVELLDHAGSIDILNLVLDADQMKKIIASISCAKSTSAYVIDKLLNEEFISKIEDDKKWIEKLGFALIEQSNRANSSQIEPFARAFARLMRWGHNKTNRSDPRDLLLENWCLQHVASGDTSKSEFSLAALAAYHQNDTIFLDKVKRHDADPLLSIEMVARLWSEDAEIILRDRLIDLSKDAHDHQIKYIWSCWCNRQSSNTILSIVSQLISALDQDPVHERNYTLLLSSSFSTLFQNRPRVHLPGIDKIKADISRLAIDGKQTAANEIAKWMVFHHFPNLSNIQLEWIVDSKGKYALPQKPYMPLKLHEIFSRIASAYPLIDLPRSREIRTIGNFIEGERELVKDKFLEGYITGETKITPAALSTWDGKKIGYLSKDEIEFLKISWRPVYRL